MAFQLLDRAPAAGVHPREEPGPSWSDGGPRAAYLLFCPLGGVHSVGRQAELLAHPSLVVHGLRLQAAVFWNVATDNGGGGGGAELKSEFSPDSPQDPCLTPVLTFQQH